MLSKDDATRLELARGYKAHLDHIRDDRALEEHLQSYSPLKAPPGQASCMMIHIVHWQHLFETDWVCSHFVQFLRAVNMRMAWTKQNGHAQEIRRP